MPAQPPPAVRAARPDEYAAIGHLVADIYERGQWATEDYLPVLRDVGARASEAEVLVAVGENDRLLGTITWAGDGPYAEQARPGEGAFRMLAVADDARGLGAGRALVQACLDRAAAAQLERVVLYTQPTMYDAHRLYERMGFAREPDRDWSPVPGVDLWAYGTDVVRCDRCGGLARVGNHDECARARCLEPPRFCVRCGRRLVVQVTPANWTARCSVHGETATG